MGGMRSASVAAGDVGVAASRVLDREAKIRYAYDLARAYAAADVADQRIMLVEGEVEQAKNILRAARVLVDAGKEARLRALQAEAALNGVTADLEGRKADRIAAYACLSALAVEIGRGAGRERGC